MPFIIGLVNVLLGAIGTALPALLARLLIALGISYVSYKGLDTLVLTLSQKLQGNLSELPSAMLQILKIGGFTTAINILCGSLTGWATLKMSSKVMAFMAPAGD